MSLKLINAILENKSILGNHAVLRCNTKYFQLHIT